MEPVAWTVCIIFHIAGSLIGRYIDMIVEKNCECGCGTMIPVLTWEGKPARFKQGHNMFGKFREQHHAWKPNSTNDSTNGQRAAIILKLLGVTECQAKNRHCKGKLDAHHIDKNHLNNDPTNLLLLCRSHHKLAHSRRLSLGELKRLNPIYIVSKGTKSCGRKIYKDRSKANWSLY